MKISLKRLLPVLSALLFAASVHAANPSDWWVDVTNDRASKVEAMLAQGADPNEISSQGQPAIMQAIRDGAWHVYDVLVVHPKTVLNAINVNRETPLMYLAVIGETKRAQDLIRRGALVNRLGWTPLQYAASKGHLDTVQMLLNNKALVNAPAPDGTTALMMAALAGSEPVVQLLLRAGADVTMQNLNGYDAARWARVRNHEKLAVELDALIASSLAERAALRERNRRAGPASSDGGGPTQAPAMVPGTPGTTAVPTAPNDPPGNADVRSPSTPPERTNSTSGSRYFDLERFEKDPQP
jgi:ankyrin repeat protein